MARKSCRLPRRFWRALRLAACGAGGAALLGASLSAWRRDALSTEASAIALLETRALGTAELWSNGSQERRLYNSMHKSEHNKFNWLLVEREANFPARFAHAALLTAHMELFVIGGSAAEGDGRLFNDVWLSTDSGESFDLVIPRSDRFSARRGHAAVLNSNKVVMFVLGGFCGKDCFMRDWWTSENGAVWNPMGDAPWSARHGHVVVCTSADKLILLGGHDGASYLNDVWTILDPAQALVYSTWKLATPSAAWHKRYGHTAVIDTKGSVFLMGGFFADKASGRIVCFNDVWTSDDDGSSWTLVTPHAPWSGRYGHVSQANSDDQLFVLGGLNEDLDRCNDAWRSVDGGRSWASVTPVTSWAARFNHASVIDPNGTIYVIGGVSSGDRGAFRDIWRSERSCLDDVECSQDNVCRDGRSAEFKGQAQPMCVGLCDKRIFDKCKEKQACRVVKSKAICVDPCEEKKCDDGYVCEVAPRGSTRHQKVLQEAYPYCLACKNAKTKAACDVLRQCDWSGGNEDCRTKCRVNDAQKPCESLDYCKWNDDSKKCFDA
eukprot:TRINITY_DN1986_c0_g4_i2.p1 TRINITY_DN1986_c0_g4~~TRINITY_DN1986_c0_g4_i2.p1  ORF type:complete len:550 (+),score=124.98 TRINITY_DN1986_c0_g4_i2:96-1745(+)